MTVTLKSLAAAIPGAQLVGDGDVAVAGVTSDSREVGSGVLFAALRGTRVDGHAFAGVAVESGAAALVVEDARVIPTGVSGLTVPDSHAALARIAAELSGRPTDTLPVVGITGTNGKTTVSYVLEAILSAAGGSPLVLGTVNFRHGSWSIPATHTTPEPISLARILAERQAKGATHAVLEVSSHALDQRRVDGVRFDVAVFTNLSREHLEYHPDMAAYFEAKARLFTELLPEHGKGPRAAVICVDDSHGQRLMERGGPALAVGYGLKAGAEISAADVELSLAGCRATALTPAGPIPLRSALVGEHNLLNILAAVGTAVALGIPTAAIAAGVEALKVIPGRLESVGSGAPLRVFVDYAHSPDALSHVAAELRRLGSGRLITVFGCAGDRDSGKRPLMARAAFEASDAVVITSDNPRTEDPAGIIAQVKAGLPIDAVAVASPAVIGQAASGTYAVEVDRASAISETIAGANKGDTVLIAGKGHETYQIIGDTRRDFDDRQIAREAVEARFGGAA